MNTNRKTGTGFECELCRFLADKGFWAHNLAQNSAGQPFDVLAARNGKSHPIDCKVCENNIFVLSRIEENQFSAMTLWRDTGNGEGWFALKMNTGVVFMIPFSKMENACLLQSALSTTEIMQKGVLLSEWVKQCE